MKNHLVFPSGGVDIDAWHFPAADNRLAGPTGRPVVVMAHGFAGTKDSGLEPFARSLAVAGLDVIAFDYRGFGASAGQPRQVISLPGQVQDYRAALRRASLLPEVDPQRMVLWGVSMAGGTILEVAAGRSDIVALVSLTPLVAGRPDHRVPRLAKLLAQGLRDKAAGALGRPRIMVPAVGRPGSAALLDVSGTFDAYRSIAGPTWHNEVSASIAVEAIGYRPDRWAAQVRCPTLFQIADFDRCVSVDAAIKTAVRARAQVRHYPCDHFDVYPGRPWHESVLTHQVRFLTRALTTDSGP